MPASLQSTQALPGNTSGSRKRSHAEITRSESHSQSPHPPSKRRRTVPSFDHIRASSSSQSPTTPLTEPARYIGDGFDFRRPAMSTTSTSHYNGQDTIDLTHDDDSPPPRPIATENTHGSNNNNASSREGSRPIQPPRHLRLPSTPIPGRSPAQAVIDLSSDTEDGQFQQSRQGPAFGPSSPDVEFVGERPVTGPPAGQGAIRRDLHLPTPPPPPAAMRHIGSMIDMVRDMTQNYFINLRRPRELPADAYDRIDGLLNHPAAERVGLDPSFDAFPDEYDAIEMDYGRAGFNFGPDVLLIENPNLPHPGLNRANELVYKEPRPAKEGFTRNYEEDDLLICGFCNDELATGKTEQKQQVWVIKQCGHAYCGDCAHERSISKNRNNKDNRRATSKKTNNFKTCTVPGCGKSVDSKTKMFQVYL